MLAQVNATRIAESGTVDFTETNPNRRTFSLTDRGLSAVNDRNPFLPTRFSVAYGGYLGGSVSIELSERTLLYTVHGMPYEATESTVIAPAETQWEEFRRAVDTLKLWSWQPDYPNPGVMDGTFWSLELAYADRALTTHGDNNYPDRAGRPTNSPDSSPPFRRLVSAILALTGRDLMNW